MKVLILSFKAGEGHNSAAGALAEQLRRDGHEAVVVDFLGLFSDKLSDFINDTHVRIVKTVPGVFGFFYKMTDAVGNALHRGKWHSSLYVYSTIVAPHVRDFIESTGPYDAIVATHFMPAQALSHLKKSGMSLPLTVAVATDVVCYPTFEEAKHVDFFVTPSETLTDVYADAGIPKEKIRPLGIPIHPRYADLPTKADARRLLGLEPNGRYYMVMGGGVGTGKLKALVTRLSERLTDEHIIAVCGRNETLKAHLTKRFQGDDRVTVLGFTKQIPEYMCACDVLFSKPGGLSTSEALACEIPIVHTDPIPGVEQANLAYCTAHACSVSGKTVKAQVDVGVRLMNDADLQAGIRAGQSRHRKPDSAERICRLIYENVKE